MSIFGPPLSTGDRYPIHDSYRNHRLENLERCAELAPEGSYEDAKNVVAAMADTMAFFETELRRQGFHVIDDNRRRNLYIALYAYVTGCNPDHTGLISGEGFGEQQGRLARRHAGR